jgi:hypothetical protein
MARTTGLAFRFFVDVDIDDIERVLGDDSGNSSPFFRVRPFGNRMLLPSMTLARRFFHIQHGLQNNSILPCGLQLGWRLQLFPSPSAVFQVVQVLRVFLLCTRLVNADRSTGPGASTTRFITVTITLLQTGKDQRKLTSCVRRKLT